MPTTTIADTAVASHDAETAIAPIDPDNVDTPTPSSPTTSCFSEIDTATPERSPSSAVADGDIVWFAQQSLDIALGGGTDSDDDFDLLSPPSESDISDFPDDLSGISE